MTEIKATNIQWHEGLLNSAHRREWLGCVGCTLWFTGLPASGKSTVAAMVERLLVQRGVHAYRLDGDNIRHGLNKNLGFSREDRCENIRRIAEVSRLFADSGCVSLTAFISPYVADRDNARDLHSDAGLYFFEVFVDAPLEVCERRDPKGQYMMARSGKIKGFTGVDAPYEPPEDPELVLKTAEMDIAESAHAVLGLLAGNDILPGRETPEVSPHA